MRPLGRKLGGWWARLTLRSRLALWYAVGGTALVSLFAATLYAFVAVRLARPLDHQLRQDLAAVERSLQVVAGMAPRWDGAALREVHAETADHPWFELWDERGNLVVRRWPFPANRNLQLPGAPNRLAPPGTISVFSVASDLRLRTLTIPFPLQGGEGYWMLRLIRVHQPHADALPDLQLIIFTSLPVVVALLVAGGYFFTRRWLLPLDRMAAAVGVTADTDERVGALVGAGGDAVITDGEVVQRDAFGVLHRAVVAQQLLDCVAKQGGMLSQTCQLVRMLQQSEHAIADQIGCRLMSGNKQQNGIGDKFIGAELIITLFCL